MTTTTKPKRATAKVAKPRSAPVPVAPSAATAVAVPSRPELRIVGGRGTHNAKPGRVTDDQLRLAKGRQEFMAQVRAGTTIRGAAMRSGISYDTVRRWRATEPDFDAEVQSAILDGNASLEDTVRKHAITDWRAAVRLLEVRDPERWAPKPQADVAVNVNLSNLSEAEERKRVQELELKLLGRIVTVDEPLPGMTASEGPETDGDGGNEGE